MFALILLNDFCLCGRSKKRQKYEAEWEIPTRLITITGQSVRQTMNPFIWIFITLLSIDAVRDMAGLTTFLGQW
jgi:hypothetical protein